MHVPKINVFVVLFFFSEVAEALQAPATQADAGMKKDLPLSLSIYILYIYVYI